MNQVPSYVSAPAFGGMSRLLPEFSTREQAYLDTMPEGRVQELKSKYPDATLSDLLVLPSSDAVSGVLNPGIGFMLHIRVSASEVYSPVILVSQSEDQQLRYFTWCANHYLTDPNYSVWSGTPTWAFSPSVPLAVQDSIKTRGLNTVKTTLPAFTGGVRPSTCNHRVLLMGNPSKMCEHVELLLYMVAEKLAEGSATFGTADIVPTLAAKLDSLLRAVPERERSVLLAKSPLEIALEKYAFRYPILVEGSQGAGKTMGARMYASKSGFAVVEMAGHEGLTTDEMCGYNFVSAGKEIWIDGQLSKACRLASKGHKVVLIVDELLRIPSRQLSIFLTLLSPYQGHYFFNTGRIVGLEDGVASMEVLKIPADNLTVIATTNVGPNFEVDDIDPALRERFYIVRQDSSREFVEAICQDLASTHGHSAALVEKLLRFYDAMHRAKTAEKVNDTPSVRILANALMLHTEEASVEGYLRSSYLQWVVRDMDGYPNRDQRLMVESAVDSAFTGE